MCNQASEDELATNIDKIIEYWDFSPLQDEDSRIERVHKEIESLIRTEKLKLLAEVREQAGEYELNMHGFYDKDVSDQITAVPLEALTKLEANQ